MAGLAGRCQGAHPSLVGRDDLVTGAVAAKAAGLEADLLGGLAAAAGVSTPSRLDSRARAHAQAAALAGATVAVLRPLLRDDGATASILAEHLGSAAAPGARALLAAAAALSLDPYRTAARRLPALRADWGGAAPAARLDAGDASTTLTLPGPCVYASALEAVGAGGGGGLPFLAAACCSADASVLAAGAGRGVRLERTAWVGDGESACVLCVTRV